MVWNVEVQEVAQQLPEAHLYCGSYTIISGSRRGSRGSLSGMVCEAFLREWAGVTQWLEKMLFMTTTGVICSSDLPSLEIWARFCSSVQFFLVQQRIALVRYCCSAIMSWVNKNTFFFSHKLLPRSSSYCSQLFELNAGFYICPCYILFYWYEFIDIFKIVFNKVLGIPPILKSSSLLINMPFHSSS